MSEPITTEDQTIDKKINKENGRCPHKKDTDEYYEWWENRGYEFIESRTIHKTGSHKGFTKFIWIKRKKINKENGRCPHKKDTDEYYEWWVQRGYEFVEDRTHKTASHEGITKCFTKFIWIKRKKINTFI